MRVSHVSQSTEPFRLLSSALSCPGLSTVISTPSQGTAGLSLLVEAQPKTEGKWLRRLQWKKESEVRLESKHKEDAFVCYLERSVLAKGLAIKAERNVVN